MQNTSATPEWREVVGWPAYAASSTGQIMRIKPGPGARAGRLRKPFLDRGGYLAVNLSENGVRQTVKVHQLVCAAFAGPRPSPLHQVRHLNGVRTDNRASNLAWGSAADNTADKFLHGTVARGSRHGFAVLSEEKVLAIRSMRNKGMRLKTIAARFGISQQNVSYIASRKRWAHVI